MNVFSCLAAAAPIRYRSRPLSFLKKETEEGRNLVTLKNIQRLVTPEEHKELGFRTISG